MTTTTAQASPGGAPAPARERTSVADRHKHDCTGAYIAIAVLIGILIGLILGYMIPHQVPSKDAAPLPAAAAAPQEVVASEANAEAAVTAPAPPAAFTTEPAKPAASAKAKPPKPPAQAAAKEEALAGAPAYRSSSCAAGYRRAKSADYAVCVKWPFDDPMGVTAAAWLSIQPAGSLESEGSAEVEGKRVAWTPLTD